VSIFIGSNAGETIEPGTVSPSVAVIGSPSTPGAGADIILAGSGDDRVAGGGGNDIVSLGAGNDLYTWNSGDGNDLVDGGSGSDTLVFNGSTAAETITVSAGTQGTTRVASSADNGSVTSTRIEHIVISAGAGDDVVDASALPAGRATLEIADAKQAEKIDQVEVGRRVAGPVRLAFRVDDSAALGQRLAEAGATVVGGPVVTPWRHRNVRLHPPEGVQLTLFTVLD